MSRRAAVALTVLALGLLVLVVLARSGDANSRAADATQAAGLSAKAARGNYWAAEYKRRWRLERRDGQARARTIRQLRRLHRVQALRPAVIDGVWVALARCESGARWHYNGSSGFDGGLQFHPSTWAAYAPAHYPGFAWLASPEQQVAVARVVLRAQGWMAWPACSSKLGLR